MTVRQSPWNKYEAIILLEGFLSSLDGKISRKDAVKRISQDLRKMALCRGMEIDSIYRNENGISFQIQSMESAYHGQTMFKPATKLFAEIANTYHNSNDEYQKLLKEAKAMINKKNSVEDDFMQYLAKQVSPSPLSALYHCYSEIETFCFKAKVLQKPLFHTTNLEIIAKVQRTIEENKIFRATHWRHYKKFVVAAQHYCTYLEENPHLQNATEPNPIIDTTAENIIFLDCTEVNSTIAKKSLNISLTQTEQDERLLQKYPIIYKRIFHALQKSFLVHKTDVSISEIGGKINQIARPSIIEEILDNASWSSGIGENYIFSTEVIDHSIILDESKDSIMESALRSDTIFKIDLNRTFDLAYTKPESFIYFAKTQPCGDSWTALYVNLVATLIDDYPHKFKQGMSFSKYNGRVELAKSTDYSFMLAPKAVPKTDYMLETNISASNIAGKIKYILNLCNIGYENIAITYSKKSATPRIACEEPENHPAPTIDSTKGNINAFSHYMVNTLKMAKSTSRSYASAINSCEAFAKEHQLSSWRLYTANINEAQETIQQLMNNEDFLAYNTMQHNRFHAALQKFLMFTGDEIAQAKPIGQTSESASSYENQAYELVLRQHFKKGFRMESPLELRKFKRYYTSTHNVTLTDPDDIITKNIKSLCIVCDGKAFLPAVMLSEDLKEKLLTYIDSAFTNGKSGVYYQAIYTEFAEAFLDQHIYNANMLKSYLMFIGHGRFYINKNFLSKEANATIDPLSEVRSCLQAYGRPVDNDELFNALPHLPQDKIKTILASNGEFVNNGPSSYFHESIVRLSDDELEEISSIIQQTIEKNDFIGGNEIYNAVKVKFPYIIQDNHSLSVYGFRDALKIKLGNKFCFKGNIISSSGQVLSMADIFAKYARSHDSFMLSEIQGLAGNLSTVVYFEPIYDNSLRISRDQFVSKASAQFSIFDTDEAIDRVCTDKYIPIQGVTNFGIFPYAGFPWNNFLLEHYVANYSRKYMLLHSSFNNTECVGAIVKRSANINSFDDLIIDLLVNNSIEMKKIPVLQFLSDNGYLARRRYSEIESLIIRANAQKQRKDKN